MPYIPQVGTAGASHAHFHHGRQLSDPVHWDVDLGATSDSASGRRGAYSFFRQPHRNSSRSPHADRELHYLRRSNHVLHEEYSFPNGESGDLPWLSTPSRVRGRNFKRRNVIRCAHGFPHVDGKRHPACSRVVADAGVIIYKVDEPVKAVLVSTVGYATITENNVQALLVCSPSVSPFDFFGSHLVRSHHCKRVAAGERYKKCAEEPLTAPPLQPAPTIAGPFLE